MPLEILTFQPFIIIFGFEGLLIYTYVLKTHTHTHFVVKYLKQSTQSHNHNKPETKEEASFSNKEWQISR